jgi:hypothetical protein
MKRTFSMRVLLLLTAIALAGVANASAAGSYGLDWWTADGGGATFSDGGSYSLGSTIGQPDAGPPMSGGAYSVSGGFWAAEGGYTLSITSEHGTVARLPDQATYLWGDVVELTATAAGGWVFESWSGDITDTANPVSVVIHGDTAVMANYRALASHYTISGNAGINGAVLSYTGGSTTANASGNYSFSVPGGWSGEVTPSLSGYFFSPASREYTFVADDQADQDYEAVAFVHPFPQPGARVCPTPFVGVVLMLSDLTRTPSGGFNPAVVTLKLDGKTVTSATSTQDLTQPASYARIVYAPPTLTAGNHTAAFTYPSSNGPTTFTWTFSAAAIQCTSSAGEPSAEEVPVEIPAEP